MKRNWMKRSGATAIGIMSLMVALVFILPAVSAAYNSYTPSYARFNGSGYSGTWQTNNLNNWGIDNTGSAVGSPLCQPYFNPVDGSGCMHLDADCGATINTYEFKQYFGLNTDHTPRTSAQSTCKFNWHVIYRVYGTVTGNQYWMSTEVVQVYITARVWDYTTNSWACNEVTHVMYSKTLGTSGEFVLDTGNIDQTSFVSCSFYANSNHRYKLVTSLGVYGSFHNDLTGQNNWGWIDVDINPVNQNNHAWLDSVTVTW